MTRLLVAIAALLAFGAAPAGAAPDARSAGSCTSGGVTVVVDYHQLGGGTQQSCDAAGGGRYASDIFRDVGVSLSYASRQPGFVCRVNNAPQSDPCVNASPADAYWGLYWSDGKGGGWTYSSSGVGGLQVPSGGSVAFAWQGSTTSNPPGVSPARAGSATPTATRAPTPTKKPSAKPTPKVTASSSATAAATSAAAPRASATASGTPSATPLVSASGPTSTAPPTASAAPTETTEPTGSATPSASAAGAATSGADDETSTSGGGLPWWLPTGLVALLAATGLGAVVWRRRGA